MTTPSAAPGAQRPLQCRLHLHVLELADGEVEVLGGVIVLVGVVVGEQLGKVGTGNPCISGGATFPILLYEEAMIAMSEFNAKLAGAGLVAVVGVALASLFSVGSLNATWVLAGFMTVGLGILLIAVLDRYSGRFSPTAPSKDEDAAGEGDESSSEPRLRVFVISSLMQGVSLAFIAGYFSGSIVVALMIGLLVGTMALAVSTLLARKLAEPA